MYSSKTNQITSRLVFSALLLTTMNAPIFGNEDTPESETHITEQNNQSYLTSMFNMLGAVTKKVTKTMSSGPAIIKKLLAGTMILLVATSGAAAENCLTTIKLNPHDLPVCYALDQQLQQPHVNPRFTRGAYQWASLALAQCETEESGDCVDVCSSHGEAISFDDYFEKTEYGDPLPPYDLPKESNFALCPANVTNFKQRIINNQEPASANLALEQLNKNANITKILLLPTNTFHGSYPNSHVGVVYKEPDCRKKLPHQKIQYTMETVKNCIAKGVIPKYLTKEKIVDGKEVVDIGVSHCFVRVTEE